MSLIQALAAEDNLPTQIVILFGKLTKKQDKNLNFHQMLLLKPLSIKYVNMVEGKGAQF